MDDFSAVAAALEGTYGVWVNTDGFTLGEQKEIFVGMRIFEIAKQTSSLRHYVWSNLDYISKVRVTSGRTAVKLTCSFETGNWIQS